MSCNLPNLLSDYRNSLNPLAPIFPLGWKFIRTRILQLQSFTSIEQLLTPIPHRDFKDWIDELAEESHLPESRPRTLSRRMSNPHITIPNVITDRYLADLSRQLEYVSQSNPSYTLAACMILHLSSPLNDSWTSRNPSIFSPSPLFNVIGSRENFLLPNFHLY